MTPEQERELFTHTPVFADLSPAYPEESVAFENYRELIAQKHAAVSAGAACECCQGMKSVRIYRFAWRGYLATRRLGWKNLVSLPLALGSHASLLHQDTVRFPSFHRLGTRCRRPILWRGYGSDLSRIAVRGLTGLLGIAIVATLVIWGVPLGSDHEWHWVSFCWLVMLVTVFTFAFRLCNRAGALSLPPFLNQISKKFSFIESIQEA